MNTEQIATKCVNEIIGQKRLFGSRLFVAITGDSGSGKSYYSSAIRNALEKIDIDYTYINADDFLISRVDREPMKTDFYESGEFKGKSRWEVLENMFRLNEFEKVIDDLRLIGRASYKPYSRDTGLIKDERTDLVAEKLIICDTSMLLEKMDFVIRVDVDIDKIIARKIVRDSDIRTPEEVEQMHRKVQGYYWTRMKPKNPNIIIDNNDFKKPFILSRL